MTMAIAMSMAVAVAMAGFMTTAMVNQWLASWQIKADLWRAVVDHGVQLLQLFLLCLCVFCCFCCFSPPFL